MALETRRCLCTRRLERVVLSAPVTSLVGPITAIQPATCKRGCFSMVVMLRFAAFLLAIEEQSTPWRQQNDVYSTIFECHTLSVGKPPSYEPEGRVSCTYMMGALPGCMPSLSHVFNAELSR